MPRLKRPCQSFTFEYKLKVIARADEIGNRAAARECEIDESMIRYWRKKKDVMTKLPKRQRTCRTGIAKFSTLERTLKEWITSQRENSHAVTTVMIHLKAKELARQMNVAEFIGGLSWCSRFMRGNRLSVRARTTVGQKLPDDWEEKVMNFREEKRSLASKQIVFSTRMKFRCRSMLHEGHACQVCDWVVRAWRAVKVTSITNGFRKAGITGGAEDGASDESDISDDEQMESVTALDPVLDAQLIDLFNSDTEDEDFNGF